MEPTVIVQDTGSAEWNLDGTFRSTELPVMVINPPSGGKSAALQLVIDAVPSRIKNLPLSYIRFDDYDSDGNINMIAVYEKDGEGSSDEPVEESESTISINGGGGTAHVTEALGVQTLLFNDSGRNFKEITAIGWNGKYGDDSEIAGVDTIAANPRLVITKNIRASKLTTAYIRRLLRLVGTVNSSSFKGWDRGEVLFEDFSYSAPDDNSASVPVTFNFAVRMNENNYSYGGKTISKLGWEYVWGISEKKNNSGVTDMKTTAAWKAQIYPFADFSGLGL